VFVETLPNNRQGEVSSEQRAECWEQIVETTRSEKQEEVRAGKSEGGQGREQGDVRADRGGGQAGWERAEVRAGRNEGRQS
jgi:hypothetical protein